LKTRHWLLLVVCAAFVAAVSHRSEAGTAEDAAYLYGQITSKMAYLSECAEFDKANAISYVDATDAYHSLMATILNKIDKIIREAARRAGEDPKNIASFYANQNETNNRVIEQNEAHDPATFVLTCRTLPAQVKSQSLWFRDLRQVNPEKMKALDDWK
jgi:hypothetical protein